MHDATGAIRLAIAFHDQFPSPAGMMAAVQAEVDMDATDVWDTVGNLAASGDPDAIAWLAAIFYIAGCIDGGRESRAYVSGGRIRSAT